MMCLGRTFSLEEGEVAGISDETEVGVSGRWKHRPSNLHIRHLKRSLQSFVFAFDMGVHKISLNGDRLSQGKSDLPKDLGKGGGMPWLGGLFWRPGFVEGINLGKPTAGAGEAPWRLPLEL